MVYSRVYKLCYNKAGYNVYPASLARNNGVLHQRTSGLLLARGETLI